MGHGLAAVQVCVQMSAVVPTGFLHRLVVHWTAVVQVPPIGSLHRPSLHVRPPEQVASGHPGGLALSAVKPPVRVAGLAFRSIASTAGAEISPRATVALVWYRALGST